MAGHDRTLHRWIESQPDLSLVQLQERCAEQLGVRIGITALWHRLRLLGLSYKKTPRAAEQDRPDVKRARILWRREQLSWDVRRLVFIDETGLNTKMARRYGRAERGASWSLFHGHLIANVEMTQERGNRLIKAGLADSIAFGRLYIANPDLPARFLAGAPLNKVSWPTVYASGPKGYTDYPALNP